MIPILSKDGYDFVHAPEIQGYILHHIEKDTDIDGKPIQIHWYYRHNGDGICFSCSSSNPPAEEGFDANFIENWEPIDEDDDITKLYKMFCQLTKLTFCEDCGEVGPYCVCSTSLDKRNEKPIVFEQKGVQKSFFDFDFGC